MNDLSCPLEYVSHVKYISVYDYILDYTYGEFWHKTIKLL